MREEELEPAQAALDVARAALAKCRAGGVVVGGTTGTLMTA